MEGKNFELPVGLSIGGSIRKEVQLLDTNGVAEKVFTKKLQDKPFTWQGNVISIAVGSIGDIQIGAEVRKQYLADNSVTIPNSVLSLSLADVNTLLVEIHRRCWDSYIPKQEIICKYCGKRLIADIDLDKIDFLEETKEAMADMPDYSKIVVDLPRGFCPPKLGKFTDKEEYAFLTELSFNRFTFRTPLLKDAIKNERYFSDSIGFWRRIAFDCLLAVDLVDDDGNVIESVPTELLTIYNIKIFNEYLDGRSLKAIRTKLMEYLPTLPFAYYDECGCDEKLQIPMAMEATNFFSE